MSTSSHPSKTEGAAQPWIYLNSHPGVGKLSIARELAKLIPGSKIIDNHLLIDLCISVFERASEEYEALRRVMRNNILTAISSTPAGRQTTYIFTGSHMQHPAIGPEIAQDYVHHAHMGAVPFVSVILACGELEHIRRATAPSRYANGRALGKLTDVAEIKRIRALEVFRFRGEHELELDVTGLTAADAARKVKEYVDSSTQAGTLQG